MDQQENQHQIEQQKSTTAIETSVEQVADRVPSLEEMLQEAERKAQEH